MNYRSVSNCRHCSRSTSAGSLFLVYVQQVVGRRLTKPPVPRPPSPVPRPPSPVPRPPSRRVASRPVPFPFFFFPFHFIPFPFLSFSSHLSNIVGRWWSGPVPPVQSDSRTVSRRTVHLTHHAHVTTGPTSIQSLHSQSQSNTHAVTHTYTGTSA